MSAEEEFRILKQNRRKVQEAERNQEIYHPFKVHIHTPSRKDKERRAHEIERKAAKGKS